MSSPGGSYEARVLLVPLGRSGCDTVDGLRQLGLEGVMTLIGPESTGGTDGTAPSFELRAVGDRGWMPTPRTRGTIEQLVVQADMVVFVACDLTEVPAELVAEVAEVGRNQGGLVAATVVGCEHWAMPEGQAMMASLREAVDMLVTVWRPELAASFVDVLRGGVRERTPPRW